MESNNNNSNNNYQGEQQLHKSPWKRKINELANDGQPAAAEEEKQQQMPEMSRSIAATSRGMIILRFVKKCQFVFTIQ
jgi:hypothetical protein